MENYAKLLGNVWHFRHLSVKDLLTIVNSGQLKRYRADAVIFQESNPSAGMFVLFRGKVHLYRLSPSGQVQILSMIEPVTMFNEVTAIDGGPNPYAAVAVKDCLTWNISAESFEALVRRYPDPVIGLAMLRVLAERTRGLIDLCEDLSFRSVIARVAKMILDLSDGGKQPIDRHEHPIRILSASIATVPETISRTLRYLSDHGLIECTRRRITVIKPEGLRREAQVEPSLTNNVESAVP